MAKTITREKLAQILMEQYAKDGEPITYEEALKCADMEIKAGDISHYVKSDDKPKTPKKPKERKVDNEKAIILDYVKKGLTLLINSTTIKTETETKLHFSYNGSDYTVMLTKHRKKKEV